MASDYTAAYIAFIGVVIGAAVSSGTQLFAQWRTRMHKRRAIALAIAAEIEALIEITDDNGYVSQFQNIADQLEKDLQIPFKGRIAAFLPDSNPFPVVKAHLGDIGMMGNCAGDIIKFCTRTMGIRGTWTKADDGGYELLPPAQKAKLIRDTLKRWENLVVLGKGLIARLRKL